MTPNNRIDSFRKHITFFSYNDFKFSLLENYYGTLILVICPSPTRGSVLDPMPKFFYESLRGALIDHEVVIHFPNEIIQKLYTLKALYDS